MSNLADISLRHATPDDLPELQDLVRAATRKLCAGDYTREQIESALHYGMGVDPQLIKDRTYFVAEYRGRIVAAGGWSFRRAILGPHHPYNLRGAERLDPLIEPARLRAFFVHPDFARRGIGRVLLAVCQAGAARAGFTRLELAATITGERLYRHAGFEIVEVLKTVFPDGVAFHGFRMSKVIDPVLTSHANPRMDMRRIPA
jgi:GNAT superfamily N-acetyltransferase